uniref:Reverse transcriptase domain-containing protein n=1 Tax=Solanum lycopersicum TaxID=4081 RepID=A0A3Q7H6A4_SOLLC
MICINYGHLNKVIVKKKYHIPHFNNMIDKRVHLYFLKMICGMIKESNIPSLAKTLAVFMELIEGVFRPYNDTFVIIFIDDILSKTKEDQDRHLREALRHVLKVHVVSKEDSQ